MAMTVAICCLLSLSRTYIKLPRVAEATDTFELQPVYSVVKSPSAVNESIFAYDLAYLEAAVEEVSRWEVSPGILRQESDLKQRSAPSNAKGSAFRL